MTSYSPSAMLTPVGSSPDNLEKSLRTTADDAILDSRTRVLLLAMRQALLIALGALEDYLNLSRSVTPKHRR